MAALVQREKSLPGLAPALLGSTFIALLLVVVAAGGLLHRETADRAAAAQATALVQDSATLRLLLARALGREWEALGAAAAAADATDPQAQARLVTAAAAVGDRLAWVGVADRSGKILAQAGELPAGEAAVGPAWFHQAMGNGAAVVLPPEGGRNGQLVLARPLKDGGGNVRGVLIYRLRLDWLGALMGAAAGAMQVDAALVDTEGRLILGEQRLLGGPLAPGEMAVARAGAERAVAFRTPGGRGYLVAGSGAVDLGAAGAPKPGWTLVLRQPDAPSPPLASAMSGAATGVVGQTALAIFLLVAGAIRFFLRPLETIARAAEAIRSREPALLPEQWRSREVAAIGAVLAAIQAERDGLARDLRAIRRQGAMAAAREERPAPPETRRRPVPLTVVGGTEDETVVALASLRQQR